MAAQKLTEELKDNKANIIGKESNLLVAKWDESAGEAVTKGLSIQAFHTNKIGLSDVKRLPESVARVAVLWN